MFIHIYIYSCMKKCLSERGRERERERERENDRASVYYKRKTRLRSTTAGNLLYPYAYKHKMKLYIMNIIITNNLLFKQTNQFFFLEDREE